MRIAKRIFEWLYMAAYLAVGLTTEWIARHKLPVAVFGPLLGVIFAVWLEARGDGQLQDHILNREFSVHLGWGALLYMLLTRLIWVAEIRTKRYLDWFAWYLLPTAIIAAINATNEWVIAMTLAPVGCEGCHWGTVGGDWARAKIMGDEPLRWKSVADMAGWQIGALACAWYTYFMPRRLWRARIGYLRHRGDISSGTGAVPEMTGA